MKNYSWPLPSGPEPHHVTTDPLPRELAHAVGTVIIAWNRIEDDQLSILAEMCGFGHAASTAHFRLGHRVLLPMGSRQRGDIFRGWIAESTLGESAKNVLTTYQRYFDTCLGNRNLIAHANYLEESFGVQITSDKGTPHIATRYLPPDAEFWERAILDMHNVQQLGMDIVTVFPSDIEKSLPEIPPPPHDLLSTLPIDIAHPPQPQSSPA